MPRALGQIDLAKKQSVVDAAIAAMADTRRLDPPMGEIARRADVSKQTIYNHFGHRQGLIAAAIARIEENPTRAAVPLVRILISERALNGVPTRVVAQTVELLALCEAGL